MSLTATRALYVKLGEGNVWAAPAFKTNTLPFGFDEISDQLALDCTKRGDFTAIADVYRRRGSAAGTATRFSNEVRAIYTAPADVLWITFAQGRMWWCFAESDVILTRDADVGFVGSRYRKTINHWSDKDLEGKTLWTNALRGSLTTTAGFRGTICRVRELEYLLRRLNGKESKATEAVRAARQSLIESMVPLIRGLHWRDFELLVELVMTQGGWRRVSATGGVQPTIDIELELPLTRERAVVQVKSTLDQNTATKIVADLIEVAGSARVFIAYHTSSEPISTDEERALFIGPEALAEHVVDLGLTIWLMDKVG